MISERKFAEKFTSFWNDMLPRGQDVSRYVNLQRDRFAPPLLSDTPASRRALVNEIGFRLFTERVAEGRVTNRSPDPLHLVTVGREIAHALEGELPLPSEGESVEPRPAEINEAIVLADRLSIFFTEYTEERPIVAAPEFAGCGIIERCRGDVLAGRTLYEVKSGESSFRLADLRQVLTYCVLNHALPVYPLQAIGLLNPRTGVFFVADLETVIRGGAGIPADSWFFEMTHFLSSQSTSG